MTSMDIKHMRYFTAIVKHGSMTEAANQLYISQPTISKAINDVEAELGVRLFNRNRKQFELTDAGQMFYDQSEEILRMHEALAYDLKNMVGVQHGHIRIGLPPIMDVSPLMAIMKTFHDKYPKITYQLIESGSGTIEQRLRQYDIDIGITVLPTEGADFDAFTFLSETLCLVVHPNHPLAESRTIGLDALRDADFIMFNEDFYLNEIINSACKNAGFTPKVIAKTSQWHFIEEMIQSELGVCILPKSVAQLLGAPSVAVEITEPVMRWRLGIVWNRDRYMNFITKEWLKHFQETFA